MEKNIVSLYHIYATIIALYRLQSSKARMYKNLRAFLLFTAKRIFLKNFIKKVNR